MREVKLLKMLYKNPEQGMEALISLYGGTVYAIIRGKLSADVFCTADIDSCVADTFSEFYLDLDKYSPALGSIKGWLCTIAKNNALDYLRKYYKTSGTASLNDEYLPECADDFSLEGDFEDKSTRKELVNAVKKLGKPDCEIIIRKFFFAQSSKEIANILGLTVSNVDTRTHRAIEKLRKQFGGDK